MQLPTPDSIRPDERILIVGIPPAEVVAALARRLTGGGLVLIARGDAVYEARRAAKAFDNVMVVPAEPGELPWTAPFFNRVFDLVGGWPQPELDRVSGRGAHA